MRVLIMAKNTPETEGIQHDMDMGAMNRFTEELVSAGILLAGDALQPSSEGVRVRFDGTERSVIDGPFTESKELVAGYWLWQVRSVDEAVEWLKRAPLGEQGEFEIRPIFEMGDPAEGSRP